jgi:hypothetical protein
LRVSKAGPITHLLRKCAACEYLLFGDGETCNHCGAELPRVSAAATSASAAPVATATAPSPTPASSPTEPVVSSSWRDRLPSTPPPVGGPPASRFAGPPPAGTPMTPPTQELWRPPAPPVVTTTKRSAPVARLALIVIVGLVLGGFGYRFVNRPGALPSGTSDWVAGKGVDYTAPDRSYKVRLPIQPQESQQPVSVGSVTASVSAAIASTSDYELGAGTIVVPVTIPPDRVDSVLEGALNGGVSNVNGDLVSKERIERGGLPAMKAKFKAPDGYSARVLVMLSGSRLYMLFVHAKTGTDKLFETLDASFTPNVFA